MHRIGQEEVELEKSVRRLREKFYGKVTITDAVILMRRFSNNHDMACKRIILCKDQMEDTDPEEEGDLSDDPVALKVIDKLKKEEEQKKQKPKNDPKNDDKIQEVAQQLKRLPLTEKNLRMFNNAQNNLIPPSDCQFSCRPCDSMWWRRVPKRKQTGWDLGGGVRYHVDNKYRWAHVEDPRIMVIPLRDLSSRLKTFTKVSRCHRCGTRYDPVPPDKMWGTAEFHCPSCGHTFKGLAQMGTPSPCYICHSPVYPSCIIPPRRVPGPRARQQHSCFAEDCHNRREPHIPGTHCVHPRSRSRRGLPKVIHACQEHASTGSTVATCLSQGSLAQYDINYLIMEDLQEEDEEDDGGSSN